MGALLGGLLSGDPEGYGEEGSGDGHHSMGDHSPGTVRELYGGSGNEASVSMGALLGEPGGGFLC